LLVTITKLCETLFFETMISTPWFKFVAMFKLMTNFVQLRRCQHHLQDWQMWCSKMNLWTQKL
jgi:hypothetical protein